MKQKQNLDTLIEKERARTDGNAFQNEYIYRKFISSKVLYDYINASIFKELSASDLVLDVGCGIGVLVEYLSYRVKTVWGIDTSKERIKHARKRLPHLEEYLLVQGGEKTSFDTDKFDAIILNCMIHHLPEPMKVIIECKRILKPGGRIIIIDANVECLYRNFMLFIANDIFNMNTEASPFPFLPVDELIRLLGNGNTNIECISGFFAPFCMFGLPGSKRVWDIVLNFDRMLSNTQTPLFDWYYKVVWSEY